MNALAKLLAHERYAQWISMDNILEVIVPQTTDLDPLDRDVPVRDFRFCRTAEEVRSRLRARAANAGPVFAYSLPQDVHVSVITREGAQSIDGGDYEGFYAPVASRVRRIDGCFGAFVGDLKASGLYDRSVIILTADHGDSLGEGGRMGHAYTLYPEIVRAPLIVHVPPAMRDRSSWDVRRASYTTDITPTLYRLLGHDTTSPGDFYGEPLARPLGSAAPQARDRMVAASYGSVYGAVLENGTRLYVADAMERRESAFRMAEGAAPGEAIDVTPEIRRAAAEVIEDTVQSLARAYQLPPR
jgi:arylsulfatase A-like enzyme